MKKGKKKKSWGHDLAVILSIIVVLCIGDSSYYKYYSEQKQKFTKEELEDFMQSDSNLDKHIQIVKDGEDYKILYRRGTDIFYYYLIDDNGITKLHHYSDKYVKDDKETAFSDTQVIKTADLFDGNVHFDYDILSATTEENYDNWFNEYLNEHEYSTGILNYNFDIYKFTDIISGEITYKLISKIDNDYYFNYETFKTESYNGYNVSKVDDSSIKSSKTYSYNELMDILNEYRKNNEVKTLELK